jgi:hypothetical protein
MLKVFAIIHDLCLALLVGGLGAVFVAAFLLFETAPNHEIAGQVGQAIFNVVGPGTLVVTILMAASRAFLKSGVAPARLARLGTGLTVIALLLAAVIALWLTPAMAVIWRTAPHAPDGSGLTGDDFTRFMSLHGTGSASYLGILLIAAALLVMRSVASVRA